MCASMHGVSMPDPHPKRHLNLSVLFGQQRTWEEKWATQNALVSELVLLLYVLRRLPVCW